MENANEDEKKTVTICVDVPVLLTMSRKALARPLWPSGVPLFPLSAQPGIHITVPTEELC